MRRITGLLALLALLLTMLPAATLAAPRDAASLEAVIVVFNDDVASPAAATAELARRHGFDPQFVYEHALKGFAASLPSGALSALSRDPRVAWIEPDQAVHAYEVPTGVERIFADDNPEITIDGRDDLRIDVDVAIIDTGIDLDHPDLNVNVAGSVNCLNHSGGPPFSRTYTCAAGGDDDNGHGSHVGGTVGALDNGFGVVGVAPGARLWAVKVLNSRGSGSLGAVTAGIDYVTANAPANGGPIKVANMSLGCECSSAAMDTAITNSVLAGVTYAVAAGNSDADASTHSPANHDDVITVSALADFDGQPGGLGSPTCRTDQDDTLADFSNWGTHIEIAAPGVCILSTVPGGGYDTFSGTSMASPHVAGAAALLASNGGTPATIETTLLAKGNLNWTDDSGDGDKEPLLDVSDPLVFNPATVAGSDPVDDGGDTNNPPTAAFTFSCTDLDCTFDGSDSSDADGSITDYAWNFGDGNTGSGATALHTYEEDGTYTVTLTVTDDDTATDSATAEVTVSSSGGGGEGTTFSVTLSGSSTNQGSTWTAFATITATDSADEAVGGTTVSGSWSTGATRECTTGASAPGQCVVSLSGILKRTGSVTFTVENATNTSTSSWDGVKASVTVTKP